MHGLATAAHARTSYKRTIMKQDVGHKEIIVTENIGIPRLGEFVSVGVPFAKGELHSVETLALFSPKKKQQPIQSTALNHWNDGSIKWLHIDFTAEASPWEQAIYRLVTNHDRNPHIHPGIRIVPGKDTWQVDTGVAVFSIDAGVFRPFSQIKRANGEILSTGGNCNLLTANGIRSVPQIESIIVETEGPLKAILAVHGSFDKKDGNILRFSSRIHFFSGSTCVHLEFTIHNSHRARHLGGLWDLGDIGSVFIRELSLAFFFPSGNVTELQCSPEPSVASIRCNEIEGSLSLYQESSGGENCFSPVHRTREGKVPFSLRGYEIHSGEKQVVVGVRATPIIWCGSVNHGVSAVLPRFWQEFPKSVSASRQHIKISLFPGCYPDLHELQGGEQKTHLAYFDFYSRPSDLEWARSPLSVTTKAEDVRHSMVIPELHPAGDNVVGKADLVDKFISGPDEFLRKREVIDEYGWRNFGDIYADHEAMNYKESEPLISHYNNQYDICAGMYRKFMATGEPLWGELASDLARHVLDIDIYHTEQDREEYNNGLFWHTDHYTSAGLSTHRSFSREQVQGKNPRYCGGGPGAEHCYTTGLMLHYFFTGNPAFRDAVVNLAEWSYRSLSGAQTLLATAKRAGRYFYMLRNAAQDKKSVFPIFPLSRGTGNTINACIDAFEVSADRKFLDRVEELIRGAMHPEDDPTLRNLIDVENTWSYTIILTAVAKYLGKCEELSEHGENYAYARACLLTYAEWMSKQEYPYLEKPEILEYPNETWPAQDLRKSVIFYYAAQYSEKKKQAGYLNRAMFFYEAATEELARHSTCHFSRPVALVLQNSWVKQRLGECLKSAIINDGEAPYKSRPTPKLCFTSVTARIFGEFLRTLANFSLIREFKWFKTRLM